MKTTLPSRLLLLLGLVLVRGFFPLLASAAPHWGGTATVTISGTVFEDPNYGGGSGRPFSAAGTTGCAGATVELYTSAGAYLLTTTTATSGAYTFSFTDANSNASYQVRVVSNTVKSNRTGYVSTLLPVQTYNGTTTRVGGESPGKADVGANTSQATLSSLTTATTVAQNLGTVAAGSSTGPDFGFNFDVIVNTNDAGQGSLRQFTLNANALGGETSLAQAGYSFSTTGTAATALVAGRETSIFMIPDGNAHDGQLAGLPSGLTTPKSTQPVSGQLVAVINVPAASGGYTLVGANAALTTVDGGTQTYNIGNTNTTVLGTGGSVGTSPTSALSYTSFSGPEVELLGVFSTTSNSKPGNAFSVRADNTTLRNMAVRNFGNAGGMGAITLDQVDPNSTQSVGPTQIVVENNVLGTDANSFTAPTPITTAEGADGRNNQHVMVPVSGTSPTTKTLTVRTNLLGYSERRGVHIQGNATLTAGYNINVSIYDNVFKGAGVSVAAPNDVAPYQNSAAGAIELIMLTTPFAEIYQNQISGPDDYLLYASAADGGSDGIQFNNAQVTITNSTVISPNNARRDAGTAQAGSRVEQNTITQQRLGILCQSNKAAASFALDGLLIKGNLVTANINGFYNQGASHTVQNNAFNANQIRGVVSLGPLVTFTNNTFNANGRDGLLVGDFSLDPSTTPATSGQSITPAYKPAVTGVVVGPGNVFSNNGSTNGSNGVGVAVVNSDTRATITQNSFYANGSLSIDLNNNTTGHDGVTANNGTLDSNFPNQEMDYPIFTATAVVGNVLTVVGYVGNTAAGNPAFGNVPVEIYAADNNPANQNGQTIAGDNLSVPHGEGRTYLGTITTNANGTFAGSITVPASAGLTTGSAVTGIATIGSGTTASTSEFGTNSQTGTPILLGRVFEDPNYGGGSGRPLTVAGTSLRQGATVELYDANGAYVSSTTTDVSGTYIFPQSLTLGSYTVRVVNSTVTSSRTGYVAGLLPVQTYNGTTTRVGGEYPKKVDTGANTTQATLSSLNTATTTPESLGTVTPTNFTGPDFGYNFDLIVNTNDAGQGSLRQFLTNANTLGGEASLAQSGTRADTVGTIVSLPAGRETSIFMIPDGNAHPGLTAYNANTNPGLASQLTTIPATSIPNSNVSTPAGSAALIDLTASGTASIVGSNASNTVLDGGTQTANIGNNTGTISLGASINSSSTATTTTVGTDARTLTAIRQTAVEILATGVTTLLDIEAPNTTVRGLALHSNRTTSDNNNTQIILVSATTLASSYSFEGLLVGTTATGSYPAAVGSYPAAISGAYGINIRNTNGTGSGGSGNVVHSFIAYNGNSGLNVNNGQSTTGINQFTNNFLFQNGYIDASGDGMTFGDGGGSGPTNIAKNYFAYQNSSAIQFEIGSTSATTTTNNTIMYAGSVISGNNTSAYEGSGIDYLQRSGSAVGSQADIISRNIVANSLAAGILIGYGQQNVTISQNSTYVNGFAPNGTANANGGLGIDLIPNSEFHVGGSNSGPNGGANYGNGDGVTKNNGNSPTSTPYEANKGADFPVLNSAIVTGGNLVVTGFCRPGAVVEFFIRDNDATGFGEGQTYFATRTEGTAQDGDSGVGSYSNASGSDGNASKFIFTLPYSTLTAAQQAALMNSNYGLTSTATLIVNGVGNTSEFSGKVITGPLPVSLTAFTAQAVANRDALLKWNTASETNNDHFDVERSFDGASFSKIGQVAGMGNKLTPTDYTLTDAGVAAKATGLVYYRLRQVDVGGAATYSPVRSVSFSATAASTSVSLYPTLTGGTTTLDLSQLPATSTYRVLVTDMTGRTVRTWEAAGGQLQSLDLSDAVTGIYHVLVTGQQPDGSVLRQSLRLTKQ